MGAPTRKRGRSRYPTRSRNAGAPGATPTFSNPFTDWTTDPLHGAWASDPLWTPPADGGAVSSWRNGGSVGTPHFTQGTGAAQPTYDAENASFNNKAVVSFDGTDDRLNCDFANLSQPVYGVAVGRWRSGGADELFALRYVSYDTSAGLRKVAVNYQLGLVTSYSVAGADENPHLFVVTLNNASSSLAVDGAAASTGDIGGSNNITEVDIGSNFTGQYGEVDIALLLIFTTDPTGQAEWASFKAWVTSFYGITVA